MIVGGSWGWAIVGLTVLVRTMSVPVTARQLKSMHGDATPGARDEGDQSQVRRGQTAPAGGDDEVLQGGKINPLAACLPLVLQLPVFISLVYMLRTDLKVHICGPQRVRASRATAPPDHLDSQIVEADHVRSTRTRR